MVGVLWFIGFNCT